MSNREREVYRWYGVEPELIFGHYPVEGDEANLVLLDRVPSCGAVGRGGPA